MAHVYRLMREKVNIVIGWTTTCNTDEITVFITVASAPCGRVYPGYAPTASLLRLGEGVFLLPLGEAHSITSHPKPGAVGIGPTITTFS